MAKKAAITKVLSCFFVFVILMSLMPVSVFAVQESSSSEAISAQGDNGDCSSVVNFKGTATTDENKVKVGICYGSYYCKVKVEELLSNPGNRLKSGNDYIVCYGDSPKNIKTRDKLEVYGEYFHTCGALQHVGNIVAFNNGYYIKKISPELLSINVWTDKSDYKIGETVTIYYQTNKKCTAKLTITKPDGGEVVYGPNEIPASTRSKSATAGYPTDKRTVVFEAWAGDEYKKAICYFDVVEEKKPDLIIHDISLSPPSPKNGDTGTFTVKIKNQGSKNAEGFYVCYYVDGSYYTRDYISSLSAGSTTTTSFTWTAKCGSHSIKAYADCYDARDESNEDNNEKSITIEIDEEIKFIGSLEGIDDPMGFTCYILDIDEVLSGPRISGRIGIMVWASNVEPGTTNYSKDVEAGDKVEVYAAFWGKQGVPWSDKKEYMGSISDKYYYVKKIADIRIVDNDRVLIEENVPQLVDPNIKWDEYAEVSIYTKRISSDLIDLYVELNSIVLKIDKKTEEAKGVSFGEGFYEGAISVLVDENAVILWPESKLLVRAEEFKLGSWPNDITYHGSLNVKERAKKHEDFYGVQKVVSYEGGNITPAFYYKYRGEMPYSDWKASYYSGSPSQFLASSLPYIGWFFTFEDLLDHLVKKGVIYARLLDKYPSEIPVENYDGIVRKWMGVDPLTKGVTCDFDSVVMKVPIKIDPSKTHKVSVRGKASPYAFKGYEDITFAKDFDINIGHESPSPVTAGEPGYIDFRSEEGSLRILDEKVITKRVHYIFDEKIKFTVMLLPSRDDPKTNYIFIEVSQCPREIYGTRKANPEMLQGFASIVIDERAQVDQNRIVTKYLNTKDFPCEPPLVPLLYPDMYKVIPELEDDNLGAVLKDVLSLVIPLVKIPRYGKICGIINSIPDLYLALNGSPKEVKEAFANDEEMDEYNTLWCHKELGRIEAHNNVVTVIPVRFYSDNNKIAVRAGVFKAGIIGGELEFLYSNTLDLSNGRPYESPIADKDILILSCPIKATITDQYNRIISDDGTNEIPNADMLITNETKIFYLPANLMYSVDIDAYDTGTFNFTRVSPIGKGISITKFENIPVTSNTKAFVDIAPGVTDYTMSIDYDGDGEIDEEKGPDVNEMIIVSLPGDDTVPPEVTILSPEEGQIYTMREIPLSVSANEPVSKWSYNLNGAAPVTFTPNTWITAREGDNSLVIYAEDFAGNVGSSAVSFVVDTTPPEVICPADVTVELETLEGTVVPLEAVATDNCDPNPTIASNELNIYPPGTTIVTFTATDASGNSASCSMNVTVYGPEEIEQRIWPSEAPVDTCKDGAGNPHSTIGENSADWFLYGGAGDWKIFDVTPDTRIHIHSRGDSCPGCVRWHINYYLDDYYGGAWHEVTFIDGPDQKGAEHDYYYVPIGDRVRIRATGGFYVAVYGLKFSDGEKIVPSSN